MWRVDAIFDWITDPNKLTAISTCVIALFTVVLAVVGYRQGRLTRQSVDLTRQSIDLSNREFIATHRPRLRVRRFRPHLTDGMPVKVSFLVVNVGDSRAHIRKFETTIGLQSMDGIAIEPKTEPLELRTLEAGETVLYITVAPELTYLDEWGVTRNIPGPSFEFRGFIDYVDDNGVSRQTGFWRIRNFQGRFSLKGDPEYEYED